jgi:hypothetical protein
MFVGFLSSTFPVDEELCILAAVNKYRFSFDPIQSVSRLSIVINLKRSKKQGRELGPQGEKAIFQDIRPGSLPIMGKEHKPEKQLSCMFPWKGSVILCGFSGTEE